MTLFYANHRCEQSVKQQISIYLTDMPIWWPSTESRAWFLFQNTVDDEDWIVHYQRRIALIQYCPFCGKALVVPEEKPLATGIVKPETVEVGGVTYEL